MKKVIVWLGAIFALSVAKVSAAPVEPEQAARWAQDFYSVQFMDHQAKAMPEFTCVYPQGSTKNSFVPYYIYNVGDGNGFVIVSGDDNATRRILGYSNKGSFRMDQMPDNVRTWLKFYEEGVYAASKSSHYAVTEDDTEPATVVVEPLLGDISYDQDAPYNDLCPGDPTMGNRTCLTGCVATALTSLATYREFPKQGAGQVDYVTKGVNIPIKADLSKSVYDWENIKHTYSGNLGDYTQVERTAIATLMRDFGYAVKMDYKASASGATVDNIVPGIVRHMGIDSLTSLRARQYYDNESQWIAMLKKGLDNKHPFYYQGSGEGGGHAFVCDGYDSKDYFHFNWGWDGFCDGFFSVNNLDPDGLGSGGGTGGGYNETQAVIFNMVPQDSARVEGDYFMVSTASMRVYGINGDSEYDLSQKFTVNFDGVWNFTVAVFDGYFALGLFQGDTLVKIISDSVEHKSASYFNSSTANEKITADLEGVEDGEYQMWMIAKSKLEGTEWNKVQCLPTRVTDLSYYEINVKNGKYGLGKTHVKVTFDITCHKDVNTMVEINSHGFPVSSATITTQGGVVELAKGNYDFHFNVRNLRPVSIMNVDVTKDTTIELALVEYMADPQILRTYVENGDDGIIMWRKCHMDSQNIYPVKYLMYLDENLHGESPVQDVTYMSYTFKDLKNGYHQLGVQSVFASDSTDVIFDSILVTEASIEMGKVFEKAMVSPNPSVDGNFQVYVPVACHLSVATVDGRIVFRREVVSEGMQTVPLTSYPSGIYFFRLETSEGWKVMKAVIR